MKTRKNYDNLTTEQKADFIADLLDTGWAGYFNTCEKLEDGRYKFYNADAETTTIYTAAELVQSAEEWDKEDIINQWEDA